MSLHQSETHRRTDNSQLEATLYSNIFHYTVHAYWFTELEYEYVYKLSP